MQGMRCKEWVQGRGARNGVQERDSMNKYKEWNSEENRGRVKNGYKEGAH